MQAGSVRALSTARAVVDALRGVARADAPEATAWRRKILGALQKLEGAGSKLAAEALKELST